MNLINFITCDLDDDNLDPIKIYIFTSSRSFVPPCHLFSFSIICYTIYTTLKTPDVF